MVESLIEKDHDEMPTVNLLESGDSNATLSASPDTFKGSKVKWLMLILSVMINFGPMVCQSIIGVLGIYLKAAPYNLTPAQVNLMLSCYSLPQIVSAFLGGVLTDKMGIMFSLILH
jgi:nitrate/nitrite transporter NarK